MSVLKELESAGLKGEFGAQLKEYVTDDAVAKEIADVVDKHGLQHAKTMKFISSKQREDKTKPGLYKAFNALQTKLQSAPKGGAKQEEKSVTKPTETAPVAAAAAPAATATPAAAPAAEGAAPADPNNVVTIPGLTEKQEEKVRERIKKEEEKMRKKLVEREAKIRDRILKRAEKSASRKGMSLEEIQGIKDAKEKIAAINATLKDLREQKKKLREEVKALRPKRVKKKKGEGTEGEGGATEPQAAAS